MIFTMKFTKGHNSTNNEMELQFLSLAHHLIIFYISVPSFVKISHRISELLSGHDFHNLQSGIIQK